MHDIHRQLEARQARRMAREHRDLERMERREAACQAQIGTLMREGREVLYVWPQGGRYREGSHGELVAFLLRTGRA